MCLRLATCLFHNNVWVLKDALSRWTNYSLRYGGSGCLTSIPYLAYKAFTLFPSTLSADIISATSS
jgi:hypothetical protein